MQKQMEISDFCILSLANAATEVLWILFCIINSSYTSIWDIKMDWGLLQLGSKNFLLRDDLVFYRWAYYVAAPINILLRFGWTLNMAGLAIGNDLVTFVIAALEAYRRIQWNFFRLENEVSLVAPLGLSSLRQTDRYFLLPCSISTIAVIIVPSKKFLYLLPLETQSRNLMVESLQMKKEAFNYLWSPVSHLQHKQAPPYLHKRVLWIPWLDPFMVVVISKIDMIWMMRFLMD